MTGTIPLPSDDDVEDLSPSRRKNTTPDNAIGRTETPVPPSRFYNTSLMPPPLPNRPKKAGSSHTTYEVRPPGYGTGDFDHDMPTFREPELVEPRGGTLLERFQDPSDEWDAPSGTAGKTSGWGDVHAMGGWDDDTMDTSGWSGGGSIFNSGTFRDTGASRQVEIDGRDQVEEREWWKAARNNNFGRPGPGILPSLLEEQLHDTDHSLAFVQVTPPDIRPTAPTAPALATTSSTPASPSTSTSIPPAPTTSSPVSSPSRTTFPSTTSVLHVVPTDTEVRASRPHPNAYYCRRDNGWVILQWKTSTVVPPVAQSFHRTYMALSENRAAYPHLHPLPDQRRRARATSCVGGEDANIGVANRSHHFHVYPQAVDANKLNPPFKRKHSWELTVRDSDGLAVPAKSKPIPIPKSEADKENVTMDEEEEEEEEEEGELLDLYMCCQCSLHCVVSRTIIPGVIPPSVLDEFVRDKMEHPTLGKSGPTTAAIAFEMILMAIENKLWKGEGRLLPVTGKTFGAKIGWNTHSKALFEHLGFTPEEMLTGPDKIPKQVLKPPSTDASTPEGAESRAKIMRAWVELGAYYADFRRRFETDLKLHEPAIKPWVNLVPSRVDIQDAIGALQDQLPRGLLGQEIVQHARKNEIFTHFGITPNTYSWSVLAFAYFAQCRCDPMNSITHFSRLVHIVRYLHDWAVDVPSELQTIILEERSRGRFTLDDVAEAAFILGFGADNHLRVELSEADEVFMYQAWRDAVRRSWRDLESDTHRQKLNDAFKYLAYSRANAWMVGIWEKERGTGMSLERAYQTLDLPKDVDETFLMTVYEMRVSDQPAALDRMKEAFSVIAEARDSERLRKYLDTGVDPGTAPEIMRMDWPRGLNQLGNTCYLNSLLQYFYTIKDLREAIQPLATVDSKGLDFDKLTDDDLKRHRVGGRNVTRREITRSKRFVSLLADLFSQLAWSEIPAVTPEVELAKLALITSKDEEEDEGEKAVAASNSTPIAAAAATSSQDLDATTPARRDSPPLAVSPGSVLGKRTRELEQSGTKMEVDSADTLTSKIGRDAPVDVQLPIAISGAEASSSSSGEKGKEAVQADGDIEMVDATATRPSLSSRKKTVMSDSVMMFGRQHDVSECMDNCVFQIETALLDFNNLGGDEDAKASVVKRLFYGKIRQRISSPGGAVGSSSIHEKEDLFSNLPVNISAEGFDIYDGLSEYFDDVVEFDGQKARMQMSLVDLPPLLQIQLQRVQFNRETMQAYKSQAYLKFGETIYMDRFLDGADPAKKTRAKEIQTELTTCRERIQVLTQGKHAPFNTALESTAAFLQENVGRYPEIGTDLPELLKTENVLLKTELDLLRARTARLKTELESVWAGATEAEYELTSVFVHRGSSPSWGHYFFYSRNLPDKSDEWFKYNDSDVSVVPKDEVLADTTGSTANPYLLVYVRKGSEVVETIHRPH